MKEETIEEKAARLNGLVVEAAAKLKAAGVLYNEICADSIDRSEKLEGMTAVKAYPSWMWANLRAVGRLGSGITLDILRKFATNGGNFR